MVVYNVVILLVKTYSGDWSTTYLLWNFLVIYSNQALVCMYLVFLLDLCFPVRCSSFDLQLFEKSVEIVIFELIFVGSGLVVVYS